MAKNNVYDFDTTAANNSDIAGINIAELCAPGNINDAIRALMALIKSGTLFADSNGDFINSSSGKLIFGLASAVCHYFQRNVSQGNPILGVTSNAGNTTAVFSCVTNYGANAAACALALGTNSVTGRSANLGGTVNTSGADYAEYMTKADGCGTIPAGAVCGVDANGYLTDKWSAAHSFVIKSTDPAYVGGDSWAAGLVEPARSPDESEAAYDGRAEVIAFRAALEAARQKVDRIAFSGQVPVNVTGATPGKWIEAVEGPGDTIAGAPVEIPSLHTVGKVWKILGDGRAWVKVL